MTSPATPPPAIGATAVAVFVFAGRPRLRGAALADGLAIGVFPKEKGRPDVERPVAFQMMWFVRLVGERLAILDHRPNAIAELSQPDDLVDRVLDQRRFLHVLLVAGQPANERIV